MNKIVLDSSALLALINQETGAELVAEHLPNAIMSSINVSEVAAILSLVDIPEDTVITIMNDLGLEIIDFDKTQALQTGFLRNKTKAAGLSLGDRACINLAIINNLKVITADKIWSTLDLKCDVVLIR